MNRLDDLFDANWKVFDKLRFISFIFLIASLPFCSKTVSQICGVSLAVWSLPALFKKESYKPIVLIFSVLFIVPILFSVIHADWTHIGRPLDSYYLMLIVPLFIFTISLKEKQTILLMKVFIGTTALAYLITISTAIYHFVNQIMPWTGRLTDVFFHEQLGFIFFEGHPTYFSLFGCVSTLLIIYFFSDHKLISCLLILFFTLMIGLLLSRITSIIQLGLVLLFVYRNLATSLRSRLILTPLLFLTIIAANIGITSVYDYPHRKLVQDISGSWERSAQPGLTVTDWGTVTRFAVWRASINVIEKHMMLGMGPGKEKDSVAEQLKVNGQDFIAELKLDPHNQYLSFLISYGILGTLMILACQLYLLVKSKDNWPYLIFLTMMALVCCTESVLLRLYGVSLFITIGTILFIRKSSIEIK